MNDLVRSSRLRLLLALSALSVLGLLAGCENKPDTPPPGFLVVGDHLAQDPKTGCVWQTNGYWVAPVLDSKGRHFCAPKDPQHDQ